MMDVEPMEQEEQKIGFRYLVIQAETLLNPELSHTDKIVFGFVELLDGKDHCYASNEYLGKLIKATGQTVSNSINRLIRSRYLKKVGFDGRKRVLMVDKEYKERYRHLLVEYEESKSDYKGPIRQGKKNYIIDKESLIVKEELPSKEGSGEEPSSSRTTSSQDTSYRRREIKIPVPKDNGKEVLQVFDHWNSKGRPLTKHKTSSKVGKASILAVGRKLDNSTTPQVVMRAIDRYYEVLASPDTRLNPAIASHCVSLGEFFGFNGYTKALMAKQKNPLGIHSWFRVCSSDEDLVKRFEQPVKARRDDNPRMTARIRNRYAKEFLHTSSPNYTQKELNTFVVSSEKLRAFGDKVKGEHGGGINQDTLLSCLFNSLQEAFGDGITIGNLVTDYTFNRLIPVYAHEKAIFIWTEAGQDF